MLDEQALEHADGDEAHVPGLPQGRANLSKQQPHQEVVAAELVGQGVVELQVWGTQRAQLLRLKLPHWAPHLTCSQIPTYCLPEGWAETPLCTVISCL